MIKKVISVGVILLVSSLVQGKVIVDDIEYDELEGRDLIRTLIDNQKYEEAQSLLEEIRISPIEKGELQGELALQRGLTAQALMLLGGQNSQMAAWIRARAYAMTPGKEKLCLDELSQVGSALQSVDYFRITFQCGKKAGAIDRAWNALEQLPETTPNLIEKLNYLLELGLFHEARRQTMASIESFSASELVRIAEIFHSKKELTTSFYILEFARIRFPENILVATSLAQLSYQMGFFLNVGFIFNSLATYEPQFHFHAAESFRQSRQRQLASFHGLMIPNVEKRMEHKIATHIDFGRFDLLAASEDAILRLGIHRKPEVLYALGYSLALSQKFARAKVHLNKLSDSKSQALLEKIEKSERETF